MWDLELEVRAQLGRYMRGETTLDDFHRWFAPATWNVHKTAHANAAELAYRIDAALAEYSSGQVTERQLRARFAPMVETYHFVYGEPERRPIVDATTPPTIQSQVVGAGR